jgi:hypothetical protein
MYTVFLSALDCRSAWAYILDSHVHIIERLQIVNQHLHWRAYRLSDEPRVKRASQSNDFLSLWRTQQDVHFHDIVTGNKTWIYYENSPTDVWLSREDDVLERPRVTVHSKKRIARVLGPSDELANRKWSIWFEIPLWTRITGSPATRPSHRKGWKKPRIIVHHDNTKPHP